MELEYGILTCLKVQMHWRMYRSLDYGFAQGNGYQELLDLFQLPSLENQRLFLSLSTFFKIIHNLIYFPTNQLPTPLSSLRYNHAHQYSIPFSHTNHFKNPFYLILSLCGITYLPKLLTVLLFICLSTILCHFSCNVHVLVLHWVHSYISIPLFVYPLHSWINFHRKKKKSWLAKRRQTSLQIMTWIYAARWQLQTHGSNSLNNLLAKSSK